MDKPYAVVIGASTGGVPALQELVSMLPQNFPAIVLVVQHIGANPSLLPELLRNRGPNPSEHAVDGEQPVPGTIYVAPPDRHMLLEPQGIRLTRGPKENHTRPAIDPLFRSAALHWRERAIGVVLTGQLDDGTAGLVAIQQCGGRTIVQNPRTAQEPAMPFNALQHVEADFCVDLQQIAGVLVDMVSVSPASREARGVADAIPEVLQHEVQIHEGVNTMDHVLRIGRPSGLTCPDCGGSLFEIESGKPLRFRCHTGHAYSPQSLQLAQRELAESALWSGVRALHEKEMLLRRLAAVSRTSGQADQAMAGERRADVFRQQATTLTQMIESDEVAAHNHSLP